jgi:hypothetical protein
MANTQNEAPNLNYFMSICNYVFFFKLSSNNQREQNISLEGWMTGKFNF